LLGRDPADIAAALRALANSRIHSTASCSNISTVSKAFPPPNFCCGEHNAHGALEWVAVQDMECAITVGAHVAELWGGRLSNCFCRIQMKR
jgi:di/tripeptidase